METPLSSECSSATQDEPSGTGTTYASGPLGRFLSLSDADVASWPALHVTERPSQSSAARPLALAHVVRLSASDSTKSSTLAHAVPSQVVAAERRLAATLGHVIELGQRPADGKGPASADDRATWTAAQAQLRDDVTSLAATVIGLPARAPERAAARTQLACVAEQLAQFELPVLARFDVGLGETWAHFSDTAPDSEGAALAACLMSCGMKREDLQRYVLEGEASAGLRRALAGAQRKGEWSALGVVRAACQLRADYLRAASRGDTAAADEAARLDRITTHLTEQRAAIHLRWGATTAARLTGKYPDQATRPKRVQQHIDNAKMAIASVRQHAVDRVTARPECYAEDSALRALAADALLVEARIAESEATLKMAREAQALVHAPQAHNDAAAPTKPILVAPPPRLPPDLAEGDLVDQKRSEALAIDPRLCDVVDGGARALEFTHDGNATLRFRLRLAEQQVAHLQSRQRPVPPQLVAGVYAQMESFFNTALATHDELVRQEPGSLTLGQTRLLAELDNDVVALAGKIAAPQRAVTKELLAYAQKVQRADGISTAADVAVAVAGKTLAASAPHMRTIPAKGPERIARLRVALSHQAAVIGLSRVVCDNAADATQIERAREADSTVANEGETVRAKLNAALAAAYAELPEALREQAADLSAHGDRLVAEARDLDRIELTRTIADQSELDRAEDLMIEELGIDPAQACAVMTEVLEAYNRSAHPSGVGGTVRVRAGKVVDARFARLGSDARATLADTLTFDVICRRCRLDEPKDGTPSPSAQEVEVYFARLACALIREGVRPVHAHELVLGEKTALNAAALATRSGLLGAAVKLPAPDVNTPAGACAATRFLVDKLTVRDRDNEAGKAAPPLHGVPLSLAPRAVWARSPMHALAF